MSNDLKKIDHSHIWHPFTQGNQWFSYDPLIIDSAKGNRLIDVDGKEYLDGVSSLWCNVHGHGVPELTNALKEQTDKLCHSTLLGLSHTPIIELTKKLIEITPANLTRAFYSDSGTAAVEAGLRIALEYFQKQSVESAKKKKKLVSLGGAYHGDTIGAVSVGFMQSFHRDLEPVVTEAIRIPSPHMLREDLSLKTDDVIAESIALIEKVFREQADEIAAFIIEPLVQGAAGIWLQTHEYLKKIKELCTKHNVLLVCDEVATGFGKTGKMFAVELADVLPDILTIGKGLSAGYLPISAALTTEEIFSAFRAPVEEMKTFFFGQTYAGNPLAAKISSANLDYFKTDKTLEKLPAKIEHFQTELSKKIAPLENVFEIRNLGLMTGIELSKEKNKFVPYPSEEEINLKITLEARKRGAIIRPLGNVMVLMPALSFSENELSQLVEITKGAIESVCAG